MIRTILSPGVEIHELDRSQYTPTTIDTYRVLLPGFSSKGEYSNPTTITSMLEFNNKFGTPTNEAERYAYNAAEIMIGAGGEVVFSRMPYDGGVKKYPYITYEISDNTDI